MKHAALLVLAAAGCARVPFQRPDAMSAVPIEPLGEDRLSLKWKFATAYRLEEVTPQEFARAAVYADTLYIGTATGTFFALRASNGAIRWRKPLGAVLCEPLAGGSTLYVGTADGTLLALDSQTGVEKWRYQSRGPIEQQPTATT